MSMALAWVAYCGVIAVTLTAAAYAWERSARWSGRAARWGWLTALAGTVSLPWLLRLIPAHAWRDAVPAALPAAVLPMDVLAVGGDVVVGGTGQGWLVGLAAGWAVLTVAVLGYLGWTVLSLRRARRRWQATQVDGAPVWLSRDLGPAAMGLRRGEIVLPAWALALPPNLRSLLLAHEREHVRAGDPRALFAGLVCAAAMPWNPLVWVQLLRLRNAIELDCDVRVLTRGADPRAYGSLLLEVGRRRSTSALVMATMAEPRLFLEQRIRRIAAWPTPRRRGRAAALSVVALALCATALSARVPLGAGLPDAAPAPSAPAGAALPAPSGPASTALPAPLSAPADEAMPAEDVFVGERAVAMPADTPRVEDRPTFTPMTVRPELRNAEEVQRALVRNYPPLVRDAGIAGTAIVWLFIDREGVVTRAQLSRESGYPSLDAAALQVAPLMRFSPALNRDQRVPVWIELPIAFSPRGVTPAPPPRSAADEARAAETAEARAAAAQARAAARGQPGPEFTPMTVRPELRNQLEVQAALARAYPPMLRDAGIGGTVTVWLFVDQAGAVQRMQLSRSSGHESLDAAALEVAGAMQFTPARNREELVSVWIEVPIVFTAS